MKKNDKELKSENMLKSLADLMAEGEALGGDREALESDIRDAGIDPKSYLAAFQKTVDDKVIAHRAAIRATRLKAESKLAALAQKIKERIEGLNGGERDALFARLEPQYAFFRNFKTASAADRITMLEDVELLAQLEKIMDEEDPKE